MLSEAANRGKYNGRYRQNCGATQRTDRPRDCWISETARRKMGRERSGSRGDGGGASSWRRWRSGPRSGRENDFRGDFAGDGYKQDRRDQGSAQRGARPWPGGSESACRRRTKDDQGRRDQSRSRRDEKENRSGGGQGRDQVIRGGGFGGDSRQRPQARRSLALPTPRVG